MTTDTGLRAEDLTSEVLDHVFGTTTPNPEPTLVLLTGQPGSGSARAIGRITAEHEGIAVVSAEDLRAFHPDYRELAASRSPEAARELSEATAAWVRACLAFARENRRSLLLEGNFTTPALVTGVASGFADEAFTTRVVMVAARRAESLLSTTSHYLNEIYEGRPARFVSRDANDHAVDATHALALALESADSIDRVTILGRDGSPAFDHRRQTGETNIPGVSAALIAAQARPLSSLRSVQWLSELRRVTEYVESLREVPRPLTEVLMDLHETALNEILPELPVPEGSQAARMQERRIAYSLAGLRQSLPVERPIDTSGPVVSPTGPERGGLGR